MVSHKLMTALVFLFSVFVVEGLIRCGDPEFPLPFCFSTELNCYIRKTQNGYQKALMCHSDEVCVEEFTNIEINAQNCAELDLEIETRKKEQKKRKEKTTKQ